VSEFGVRLDFIWYHESLLIGCLFRLYVLEMGRGGGGDVRREDNLLMGLGSRIEILVPHYRRLGMEFDHKFERPAGRRSPKCHIV
jgi:hypothetical protein